MAEENTKSSGAETPESANSQQETTSNENTRLSLDTFIGVKSGMTRIFDQNGNHVPVTVIKLIPNKVSQVKTPSKDGYSAYQVAYFEKRPKLINQSKQGHLKKAGLDPVMARATEVRTAEVDEGNLGKELSLEQFSPDTYVDVTGISKGKGFQGVMKKFGFSGGPMSHGSHFHRRPGSIGNRATPGKVFKNKKMPGQLGKEKVTVQNLKVVQVNEEKGFLLIKGSIPGSKNSFIKVSKATKK